MQMLKVVYVSRSLHVEKRDEINRLLRARLSRLGARLNELTN
jgi:hypothetical protein